MSVDLHFKDRMPKETITRIMSILDSCGVPLEVHWTKMNGYGAYSLRATIKGTHIGQNGKGISKEFAMASALAEFMERLQNNVLFQCDFSAQTRSAFGFEYFPDEKYISVSELTADNPSLPAYWFDGHSMDENLLCVPFYSAREGRKHYLPIEILLNRHNTNGMCSGNTLQEAMVQGISEIFERRTQRKLLTGHISLPDVPRDYIKRYKKIDSMLSSLEAEDGYKFIIKDASGIEDYPVAVFIAVNMRKGTFGLKLGAHPQYDIAIERSMTEAFQGKGLEEFSQYCNLDFDIAGVDSYTNMFNSYKVGMGTYPPEIFRNTQHLLFKEPECVSADNGAMCDWVIKKICARGLDLFVRDVNYLKFPAYHIVIPGLSEMFEEKHNILLDKISNTKNYVACILKHTESLTKKKVEYLYNLLEITNNNQIERNISYLYKLPVTNGFFPFEKDGIGHLYLSAVCCGMLSLWERGEKFLCQMVHAYECNKQAVPSILPALSKLFGGLSKGRAVSEMKEYLSVFYDADTVHSCMDALDCIEKFKIPFMQPMNCHHCDECKVAINCGYRQVEKIWLHLKSKMIEYFPDQENLKHDLDKYTRELSAAYKGPILVRHDKDNLWGKAFQPAEYLEASRIKLLHKEFAPVIRELTGMTSGMKILEVGCGSGCFTSYLENVSSGMTIFGIDNDRILIDKAAKRQFSNNKVSYICGDARNLPFEESNFDMVISHTFFQCVDQKHVILNEMKRVVKPNGCIAAIVPMSLEIQASHAGNYPTSATWVPRLRQLEQMVDKLIKEELNIQFLSVNNDTANHMPQLFVDAGLKNIRMLPLGKTFSLSNAIMSMNDKQKFIDNWYMGEMKRFKAMMEYPSFRNKMTGIDEEYTSLLKAKFDFWCDHLDDNSIFEWEGNSAMIICGEK